MLYRLSSNGQSKWRFQAVNNFISILSQPSIKLHTPANFTRHPIMPQGRGHTLDHSLSLCVCVCTMGAGERQVLRCTALAHCSAPSATTWLYQLAAFTLAGRPEHRGGD